MRKNIFRIRNVDQSLEILRAYYLRKMTDYAQMVTIFRKKNALNLIHYVKKSYFYKL